MPTDPAHAAAAPPTDPPAKATQEPRPYIVWELKGDSIWAFQGVYRALNRDEALSAAAKDGEEDGQERTGDFFAAPQGYVGGKSFVKETKPTVNSSPLTVPGTEGADELEEPPVAPKLDPETLAESLLA